MDDDRYFLPIRIEVFGKQFGEDQAQEPVFWTRSPGVSIPQRCLDCLQFDKEGRQCKIGHRMVMGKCYEPVPPGVLT